MSENTKTFEQELEEAKAATKAYEDEAARSKAATAQRERDIELMSYSVSRSDSFDGACATLGLTPYSKSAMLTLMQGGIAGIEFVNENGKCKVYVDRVESSMAGALGRLKVAEPTHFREQPFAAQPGDPDEQIKARDEFRSEDHRIAFIKKYGLQRFTELRSTSSQVYRGPATRLTREQYRQLCPEEQLRAKIELGLEGFERLMCGKSGDRRW